MLSRKAYLQKYNEIYHQENRFLKHQKHHLLYRDIQNFVYSLSFLCLPILFVFILDLYLVNNHINWQGNLAGEYKNSSNKIFYENIPNENTLDLGTNEPNLLLLSYNNYNSKFEEVIQHYKNNFSEKLLTTKNINGSNKIINLPNNLSKKKKEFINKILPLIINQNHKILAQRHKLIEIKDFLNQNKTLNKADQKLIKSLASKYLVINNNRHKIDVINDLLVCIDIIPNSIVLAQAANESGWGSSRFAKEYNAFFGQYTYDAQIGIAPSRRDTGDKHLIKFFSSINKSVESYFININSHFAYNEFRKIRKILRDKNHSLNINLLVNKLNVYAEDDNYVNTINSIIKVNKLTKYDNIKFLLTNS